MSCRFEPNCVICFPPSSPFDPNVPFDLHAALLQIDQAVSPTSPDTSKSRRRGLGKVQDEESRSAFDPLAAFERSLLYAESEGAAKRPTGLSERCRRCRSLPAPHREGLRRS